MIIEKLWYIQEMNHQYRVGTASKIIRSPAAFCLITAS
jgi:hypothetical protein